MKKRVYNSNCCSAVVIVVVVDIIDRGSLFACHQLETAQGVSFVKQTTMPPSPLPLPPSDTRDGRNLRERGVHECVERVKMGLGLGRPWRPPGHLPRRCILPSPVPEHLPRFCTWLVGLVCDGGFDLDHQFN